MTKRGELCIRKVMDTEKKQKNSAVDAAVKRAGSTELLARLCGVTQPAVMKWLYGRVPAERAVQIEAATGVAREELRPDLFRRNSGGN